MRLLCIVLAVAFVASVAGVAPAVAADGATSQESTETASTKTDKTPTATPTEDAVSDEPAEPGTEIDDPVPTDAATDDDQKVPKASTEAAPVTVEAVPEAETPPPTMALVAPLVAPPLSSVPGTLTADGSFDGADFKQAANDHDFPLGGVDYIGSIIQASNSVYYEGMSVPQRLLLKDIPATGGDAHAVTFEHQATKGGIHAYDFLTSYAQADAAAADLGVPYDDLWGQAHRPDTDPPKPDSSNAMRWLLDNGFSYSVNVPDDPFVSKDGSTQDRIDAYEVIYGNRVIQVFGEKPITSASLTAAHTVADGADTGDSFIQYELSWVSESSFILVMFAGHLSVSGDPVLNGVAWGDGLGSSFVSGGPYHMIIGDVDEISLGSQDNQIKGADILVIPATKTGTKFEDENADGIRDPGELGLAGWTIYVDYDNDGVLDAEEPFGVTDDNGAYTITEVDPGTWHVREVMQPGWTQSMPAGPEYSYEETFTAGTTYPGNDFGNWAPASIEGMKFHDLDADGNKDPGELGLEGWRIFVDYNDDGLHDMGVEPYDDTDVDGYYKIMGVTPGTWKVYEVPKDGWTQSHPTGPIYHEVTFTSRDTLRGDGEEVDYDFGNWTTATKSGTKFEDIDGDGSAREPGEIGLGGWMIYVDYNDDGLHTPGEPFALTSDEGTYTITGIDPGTYKVREVEKPGYSNTYPASGYYEVPFVSGLVDRGNDFGNAPLWDKDFLLTIANGNPGHPDVTYHVDYKADGVDQGPLDLLPQFVMGPDAHYSAPGGTYVAGTEITDVEWFAMWDHDGSGATDPVKIVLGREHFDPDPPEVLTQDTENQFTYSGELDAFKFEDLVEDGTWDDGEDPLEGWEIHLYRQVDSAWFLWATEFTDDQGLVEFHGVLPGFHYVAEVLQPGWAQTAGPGAYGTDPAASVIPVIDGFEGSVEFGNRHPQKTFSLTFDGPEPLGADGYFVEYTVSTPPPAPPDGIVNAIALFRESLTASDGAWVYVDPDRWAGETISSVRWFATVGDAEYLLGETPGELLGSSDVVNEFEYDNILGGHKWDDSGPPETGGADGVWDAGEPPIEGWEIGLYVMENQAWSHVASMTTDPTGLYGWQNLLPGTYSVIEEMQELAPPFEWKQSFGPTALGDVQFAVADESVFEQDFGNYTFLGFQDLALEKTGDEDYVPGETVDYTISYWVTSGGPFTGPDFKITDDYDERYVAEIVDANGGVVADGTITWDLDARHPGGLAFEDGKQTITYTVRIKDVEELPDTLPDVFNLGTIEHPQDGDDSNNSDDHVTKTGFLPFTGGTAALLFAVAMLAAIAGLALKRRYAIQAAD